MELARYWRVAKVWMQQRVLSILSYQANSLLSYIGLPYDKIAAG